MAKTFHSFNVLIAVVQAIYLLVMMSTFRSLAINLSPALEQFYHLSGLLLIVLLILSRNIGGISIVSVPNALCSIAITITLMIEPGSYYGKLGFNFSVGFFIIHIIFIYFFHMHTLSLPSGRFKVGYMSVKQGDLLFSIYYPSEEEGTRKAKLMTEEVAYHKMYELVSSVGAGRLIPRWGFDIGVHFLRHIEINAFYDVPLVPADSPALDTPNKKLVPIVFSHGLGVGRDTCSTLVTELASHGHFILSPEYIEDSRRIFMEKGFDHRREALAARVQICKTLLDDLQNSKLLEDLFKRPVEIDFDKVIVMGHSFGGATALATSYEDKRVKNCVMLDPWLYMMKEEELQRKVPCNMMVLESESWNSVFPVMGVTKRNQLLMESQRGGDKLALYTIVKTSDHISFTDMPILIGRMCWLALQIRNEGRAVELLNFTIRLVQRYTSVVIEHADKDTDVKVQTDRFLAPFAEHKDIAFQIY